MEYIKTDSETVIIHRSSYIISKHGEAAIVDSYYETVLLCWLLAAIFSIELAVGFSIISIIHTWAWGPSKYIHSIQFHSIQCNSIEFHCISFNFEKKQMSHSKYIIWFDFIQIMFPLIFISPM